VTQNSIASEVNIATSISIAPDVTALEVPMDAWTQPFWDAAANERIIMPRCKACDTYRWPPGPFCPVCSAQEVIWGDAGPGRIYSYTVIQGPTVPALIEFPEAGRMRLLAAIVDTALAAIRVGAPVRAGFSQAVNARIPVFRVLAEPNDQRS
jgi:hypothetical protein